MRAIIATPPVSLCYMFGPHPPAAIHEVGGTATLKSTTGTTAARRLKSSAAPGASLATSYARESRAVVWWGAVFYNRMKYANQITPS